MILNTCGRTDTVQYFTPWLLKRFEEGYLVEKSNVSTKGNQI